MPEGSMTRCALFAASLALFLTGCGSRSSLLDGVASPPSTGSVEPPPPPACVPLTEAGARVTLSEVVGFGAQRPAIAPLGDGSEIAIVFGLHPTVSSEPALDAIADVALDPWGAWPPAAAAPHQVADSGGEAFVVAPRGDATYSLLAAGPAGASQFAASVDPMGTAALAPSVDKGTPRFLARAGDVFLRSVEGGDGDDPAAAFRWLVVDVSEENGPGLGTLNCGLDSLVGDAIPFFASGFLAAVTNQAVNPLCTSSNGTFAQGPASDLWIRGYPVGGAAIPAPQMIPFGAAIERVRLVRRSAGAWVLAQTRGADGTRGPVEALRIDAAGMADPVSEAFAAAPAGTFGFAAAPLGDGFVIAWVEAGAIGVATFDDAGTKRASTSLTVAGSISDPVAVIAAEDASAIVVAWSEDAQVRVTRLGCLSAD
jgi:hypothetical protein